MQMERTVERAALRLQSDRFQLFSTAVNYIGWQRGADHIKFCRLLQELLAYKRGALMDHLVECICMISPDHEGDERHNLQLQTCRLMSVLSESVPIAKYVMKIKQKIRPIAGALLKALLYLLQNIPKQLRGQKFIPRHLMADPNEGNETHVYLELAIEIVRVFDNFSRASKSFRLVLQQIEGIFPSLERLVSRDITSLASAQVLQNALTNIHNLMRTFALSEDSQQWSFEQGLLRIQAATTRLALAKGVVEEEFSVTPSAEMRRLWASQERELLNLDKQIRRDKISEKVRRLQALFVESFRKRSTSFESFIRSIHGDLPHTVRQMEQETRKLEDSHAASLETLEWRGAPIVCSWELCEAGSTVDAGRSFSRCAKCELAYYCRLVSKRLQAEMLSFKQRPIGLQAIVSVLRLILSGSHCV